MKNKYTKNKTQLAKDCGFKSRQGLYEFMQKPGWPEEIPGKGWCIADCRKFVLEHTQKDAIRANIDSDVQDLKRWEIYERARKLKILNDTNAGVLVHREDVVKAIANVTDAVKDILEQKLENEYPHAVAGLDVPQARVYGRRLYDQVLAEFHKLGQIWREVRTGNEIE